MRRAIGKTVACTVALATLGGGVWTALQRVKKPHVAQTIGPVPKGPYRVKTAQCLTESAPSRATRTLLPEEEAPDFS